MVPCSAACSTSIRNCPRWAAQRSSGSATSHLLTAREWNAVVIRSVAAATRSSAEVVTARSVGALIGPLPALLCPAAGRTAQSAHRARCGSTPPVGALPAPGPRPRRRRSEEHTSELQSRGHLVCRLLLEKKKLREGACAAR